MRCRATITCQLDSVKELFPFEDVGKDNKPVRLTVDLGGHSFTVTGPYAVDAPRVEATVTLTLSGETMLEPALPEVEVNRYPASRPRPPEPVSEKPVFEEPMKSAHGLLLEAAETLNSRGKERDKPNGERSMACAVRIYNAIHPELAMSEVQGWRFMQCLKLAREVQGGFKEDDYLDGIGYAALKAECAIAMQHEEN